MSESKTVILDETMQEIVDLAIQEGDGQTAEEIVRLALEGWWSKQMLSGYSSDDLRRMGEEIVADTRPGIPLEQAFFELQEYCRKLETQHRTVDAA